MVLGLHYCPPRRGKPDKCVGVGRHYVNHRARVAPRSKALVNCCLMVAFALFFFPRISLETAVEIFPHRSK
jgi:hypothetical protein